jgi:hypothetical protein
MSIDVCCFPKADKRGHNRIVRFVPNSAMAVINGKFAPDDRFTAAWFVGVPEKEPLPVSCVPKPEFFQSDRRTCIWLKL